MKKTLISEKTLLSENGLELRLAYSLIKENGYGIELLCNGDALTICSVTTNRDRCVRLIESMARCGVTPTTAFDVIEDWL